MKHILALLCAWIFLVASAFAGQAPILETDPNEPTVIELPAPAVKAEPKVVYVRAPAPAPVSVEAVAEKATGALSVKDFLYSPVAIGLLVFVAVFALKRLDEKGKIDADKWVALTYHAYNAAESAGLLNNFKGRDKLHYAMQTFEAEFTKAFGHAPTARDRTEFEHDLARLAYDDETTLNARRGQEFLTATAAGQPRGVANLVRPTT